LSLDFDGETRTIAEPLLDTIRRRLALLVELGVEYLALNRSGASLSGGEWQRVRLATQLGTGLSGVCYVLDEPTAGLHPRDTKRLLEILNRLASLDNTVVAVEHDPAIMAEASHWIDIGPGAGEDGGKLVAQGRPEDVLDCDESLTAQYFNGNVQAWRTRESSTTSSDQGITLRGVSANNLKNLDLTFPLGRLVCVTGVSGSGKSTLVRDVLARAVQAELGRVGLRSLALRSIEGTSRVSSVIEVGASPIGKTSRSTPATYLGILHHVRSLFATTHQAKIRGYAPARFSFNVKGGRCEACRGQGEKRIAMHFLPDVFVTCDQCEGTRYNRETLDVRYRGKNIAEVLDLTVDQARRFFENIPQVSRRLAALEDVGLGYVTLGQPSNTLSGGEAQRIKLAERLMGRSDLLGSLYILDEPTTGLHFADVERLILLLHRLVDEGNSVVVTEHNLDVIRSADWIIDLGPEGGEGGGQIVTQGKPQEIALHPSSHTGRFLRNHE
jgi:excinuclease ABC subunit A